MKIIFPVLLLCSLAHAAPCPTGQAKDESTLIQIEHAWVQADGQRDVAALWCILADEFEEADSTGALIDRSAMLANAAKQNAANGGDVHFELSELHAHIYGDVAYVRGIGLGTKNGRTTVKSRFTDFFVYREGRWQCVAGHESHFPEVR